MQGRRERHLMSVAEVAQFLNLSRGYVVRKLLCKHVLRPVVVISGRMCALCAKEEAYWLLWRVSLGNAHSPNWGGATNRPMLLWHARLLVCMAKTRDNYGPTVIISVVSLTMSTGTPNTLAGIWNLPP